MSGIPRVTESVPLVLRLAVASLSVLVFCVAACVAACGASDGSSGMEGGPPYTATLPSGPCGAVVQQHVIEGATHVPYCSYVDYHTLPPSSGDHYPSWAAYTTFDRPVPEGYWVHDLEHGAIVFSYNCGAAGCPNDVAAAQATMDQFPVDPLCAGQGVAHRLLMTPDPRLDVRFAASAWGWTLRASCFDPVAFLAFARAHYGQGPEPLLCTNGQDVVVPSADPPGCGAAP